MKKKYYVHTLEQANGDHEVHAEGCIWMPKPENRTDLGEHFSCTTAVTAAGFYHRQVNGCVHCSKPCHTQ